MPTYPGSDGAVLHYDLLGEPAAGPPAIVLAGGAARHPAYLGDLAGSSARLPLAVVHGRGVGRSAAPADPDRGSFWRQAEDVDRLRQQLGQSHCLLIAHSAGTRVAVAFAAQYADRLAGLVLITPPAGYLVDVPSDADAVRDRRRGDPDFDAAWSEFDVDLDDPDDGSYSAWQRSTAAVGYAAWGPREQEHAADARYHAAAAENFFRIDPPADLVARLATVTAPVLVVAGAADCLLGLAPVRAVADLFPAGRAVVLDDCGHYPWVERPEAFRAALGPFLDSVRPRVSP